MGGSVSAGKTNDELIDHLVEAEFIKTPLIQRVFRAVDRGNYYIANQKVHAYKDIAWKMGKLHLSAPCVYSVVMEALKLRAGLSFLNLGSGSGYLSTMAGLVLGPYGVNHGVELYSDIVDFAYERLEEFLKNSNAIDEYDFCEPTFTVGNCLKLDSTCQQYDRVYCGASCPEEYEPYLKNLIKVGGILIMPLNEKLLKITRTAEDRWHVVKVLSVSFAPLISSTPNKESKEALPETVKLGDISPPKLQHICRSQIRTILRGHIDVEHPNLKQKQLRKERRPIRQVRRIVIPFYDESDLSNSDTDGSNIDYDSDAPEYTISSRLPSRMSVFLEDFLRRHAELQLLRDMEEQISISNSDSNDSWAIPPDSDEDRRNSVAESRENRSTDELFSLVAVTNVTQAGSSDESSSFLNPPSQSTRSQKKKRLQKKDAATPSTSSKDASVAGTSSGSTGEHSRKTMKRNAVAGTSSESKNKAGSDSTAVAGTSSGSTGYYCRKTMKRSVVSGTSSESKNKADSDSTAVAGTSSGSTRERRRTVKRTAMAGTSSESKSSDKADSESIVERRKRFKRAAKAGASAESTGEPRLRGKRVINRAGPSSEATRPKKKVKRTAATVVWKKQIEEEKKEVEEDSADTENYSEFMVAKIGALPLPSLLLRYLNYRRENL